MTSYERHELRYQRRKAAREAKRKERLNEALDFNKVFTFSHMYQSAKMCFKGVSWKASVQAFKARCGINVARRLRELRSGVCKLRKCPEFEIRERGHIRRINSIHIDDRVPQKCNSQYSLKPVLHRTLVYDNYASQEGKGTDKARRRLKCKLERHIRKYGMTGGMIVFDLRHFFDSIQHSLVRWVMDKHYDDKWIIGFNMKVVRQCRKDDFTETGHIIIRPARASVVRERRKLKKLAGKFLRGELPFSTCRNSVEAWKASIAGTKCEKIKDSIDKLFDRLLITPWLVGEETRPCSTKSYQAGRSSTFATA